MSEVFTRNDYLTIINTALDNLVAKHPGDQQSVAIVRKAVEQLVSIPAERTRSTPANSNQQPRKRKKAPEGELGKQIAAAGGKLFGSEIVKPVSIAELLPTMRIAVPSLPPDDHAAKIAITRAFMNREEQFAQYKGQKSRDPSRWYAKR